MTMRPRIDTTAFGSTTIEGPSIPAVIQMIL
jgi:hypothetical protein